MYATLIIVSSLLAFACPVWREHRRRVGYGHRKHAERLLRRMTRDEVVRVLQRAKLPSTGD